MWTKIFRSEVARGFEQSSSWINEIEQILGSKIEESGIHNEQWASLRVMCTARLRQRTSRVPRGGDSLHQTLGLFCVKLVDDALAVLSLRLLCGTMRYNGLNDVVQGMRLPAVGVQHSTGDLLFVFISSWKAFLQEVLGRVLF